MEESSLERGFAILEVVAVPGEHTPAAIADAIGMPVSTTYRYLRRLRERELVTVHRGRYEPGPALLALSGRHFAHSFLSTVGPAVLSGIVDTVGETAVMITRIGTRALCLRRVEPDKPIRYTFAVNQLLPLHAGAGQRVLLAWAPGTVIERVLAGDLTRYTDATLTEPQLRQSISRIRQTGWALSRGEYDAGSVSIAVPVVVGGEAVCSLNVAGPESRCGSRMWVQRVLGVLNEAAADLAASLESWSIEGPRDLDTRDLDTRDLDTRATSSLATRSPVATRSPQKKDRA